jgi:hypothetical protein
VVHGASWPEDALCEAARLVGLSIENKRLLRIGHCAIVALPLHRLVARIARPGTPSERLESEMHFARFVRHAGLPVLSPADAVARRPIETMSGPVTFWPLVESTGDDIDWRWLGDTLKRMHELRPPLGMVSLWNPVEVVEARLGSYGSSWGASPEHVHVLSGLCSWARRIVGSGSLADSVGLIHGDPTNVIMTADGPVLIDFDLSGPGPPSWDLVSIAIRHRRFGLSLEHLQQFYDSYGFDPPADVSFEDLLRVRELLDCSFALTAIHGDGPGADHELALRLRALRDPSDRSRWTPIGVAMGTK